jgi:hypothetical protein
MLRRSTWSGADTFCRSCIYASAVGSCIRLERQLLLSLTRLAILYLTYPGSARGFLPIRVTHAEVRRRIG